MSNSEIAMTRSRVGTRVNKSQYNKCEEELKCAAILGLLGRLDKALAMP